MTTHFFPPREITLEKRNNTFLYILLLSMPTFVIIGIVFLVLYLLQVPMNINGVDRTFSDPEYQRFFRLFPLVVFFPLIAGVPIYLTYKTRAVNTRITLSSDENFEPCLYVEEKSKQIYIDSKRLITLNKKSDEITVITDPYKIEIEKTKYLFWSNMEKQENFKITNKPNGFKVSYLIKGNHGSKKHVFNIKTDSMRKLLSYRQRISSRYGSRNSTQGFYGYHRLETKKSKLDIRIIRALESDIN